MAVPGSISCLLPAVQRQAAAVRTSSADHEWLPIDSSLQPLVIKTAAQRGHGGAAASGPATDAGRPAWMHVRLRVAGRPAGGEVPPDGFRAVQRLRGRSIDLAIALRCGNQRN